MLSVNVDIEDDANELTVNIIDACMWLTIQDFTIASSLLEEYKRTVKTNASKTESLREDLQKGKGHSAMPDQ